MTTLTKIILISAMIIWLSLSMIDIYGNFFVEKAKHPVIWRAWEVVSNFTGKDGSVAPFKPLITYDGKLEGDLINGANVIPRDTSRKQLFIVDEYGYRNEPHFLDTPIDAVVIGSSFVGGAAFSQKDLVTSILTNKYGIRAYNYVSSIQTVWEDEKFKKNEPRFVILLGQEGEVMGSDWRYNILDREPIYKSKAWSTHEEWRIANEVKPKTFELWSNGLRDFSLIRFGANILIKKIVTIGKDWNEIVAITPYSTIQYDLESDMLFYQIEYDNPLINSIGKTPADISKAIITLNETHQKLQSREMSLVVAAMPSKTHLELARYRYLNDSERALSYYNQLASEKGSYINVDLFEAIKPHLSDRNWHAYFPDDSHWNVESNELIAYELAKKLCPKLPKSHICHTTIK